MVDFDVTNKISTTDRRRGSTVQSTLDSGTEFQATIYENTDRVSTSVIYKQLIDLK